MPIPFHTPPFSTEIPAVLDRLERAIGVSVRTNQHYIIAARTEDVALLIAELRRGRDDLPAPLCNLPAIPSQPPSPNSP